MKYLSKQKHFQIIFNYNQRIKLNVRRCMRNVKIK